MDSQQKRVSWVGVGGWVRGMESMGVAPTIASHPLPAEILETAVGLNLDITKRMPQTQEWVGGVSIAHNRCCFRILDLDILATVISQQCQ